MRSRFYWFLFALCVALATTTTAAVAPCAGKEPTQVAADATAKQTGTADFKRCPKDTNAYTRFSDFSGYRWSTKVQDRPAGPGPNYFSDREEDLWVDEEGLHLTISQRDGKWYCTEVILQESFGYGTYIFQTNAQFVVQPFTASGNLVRYRVEPDEKSAYLTQVMTWEEGKVRFMTARGRYNSPSIPAEAVIINWTNAGSSVPTPGKENVRIN